MRVWPFFSAQETRVRPAWRVYPVFIPVHPSYCHSSLLWFTSCRPSRVICLVATAFATVGFSRQARASLAMSRAEA